MPDSEQQIVRIDTKDAAVWHDCEGGQKCPLFSSAYENVCMLKLVPGAPVLQSAAKGAELLVLDESVVLQGRAYPSGSWIRLPPDDLAHVTSGPQGAMLYLKTGHLPA